jgi:hypothetical protein
MTIERAVELFEDFTGHPGDQTRKYNMHTPKQGEALVYVGRVVAIAYEATRDGETEHWEHEFRSSSRPVLAASSDGKHLYLLAGAYRFTHRGIEDR